jgi:surface protein
MTTIIGSEREPGNPTSDSGQPRPRSKLSIAVAKAAAELEASKKEKQSETAAAADALSAISASASSEVADQPADDAISSSNDNKDIEASALPTNITDSNADINKPSAHVEEVVSDTEIIAWWKRRVAKIFLIFCISVSVLAIGLGVGLGVAFSRQPPTSTAPTSTATEEEGAPAASSGDSSTLLGYCNESSPSTGTGDSKDIIVNYKYTMITDDSANAAISVASRMEEQIHDAVMIEKCTMDTPERKLQVPEEVSSNDVSYTGFKSSPADVISSDSCPNSTNVPEGKVCSVVEGGITAVVPTDTNDAIVRQSMSNFLQQVLSNNTIANDVGTTDITYVPSDDTVTATQGSEEDASVEAQVSTGTDDVPSTTSPSQSPSQIPTENTSAGSVTSCSYELFATRDELKAAVDEYVSSGCNEGANVCPNITSKYGWPMNSWCVGNVTDMSELFRGMRTFNEDVSSWNVSQVQDMNYMFRGASSFNGDISLWDVSRVQDMSRMFKDASSFNGNLSLWDVSQVQDMRFMFSGASSFNGDLSLWNVSQVRDMRYMFADADSFNADISLWDVSRVQYMNYMFTRLPHSMVMVIYLRGMLVRYKI